MAFEWIVGNNGLVDVEQMRGKKLLLTTPEEFAKMPTGTQLFDIFGNECVVGINTFDLDVRSGYMAYGILVK